jgi:hypothetical protein
VQQTVGSTWRSNWQPRAPCDRDMRPLHALLSARAGPACTMQVQGWQLMIHSCPHVHTHNCQQCFTHFDFPTAESPSKITFTPSDRVNCSAFTTSVWACGAKRPSRLAGTSWSSAPCGPVLPGPAPAAEYVSASYGFLPEQTAARGTWLAGRLTFHAATD